MFLFLRSLGLLFLLWPLLLLWLLLLLVLRWLLLLGVSGATESAMLGVRTANAPCTFRDSVVDGLGEQVAYGSGLKQCRWQHQLIPPLVRHMI